MQSFWITTKYTKKMAAWQPKDLNPKKEIENIRELRKKRIIKEYHYFKTEKRAINFTIKDKEKDMKSFWGKPFKDSKTGRYAIVKYRKY